MPVYLGERRKSVFLRGLALPQLQEKIGHADREPANRDP